MKPGDLVQWKINVVLELENSEIGILIEPVSFPHDPWRWWKVMFSMRDSVQTCRETDLLKV